MGDRYIAARSAVKVAVETTPGTYAAPTTVLPLERGDGGIWEPEYDKDVSDPASAHHGSKETDIITMFASVSVSPKMKLPADRTLIEPMLNACGIVGTAVTDGTSYNYDSNNGMTVSLEQVALRQSTQVYGARSNMKLTCEVGKAAEITFDLKGSLKDVVNLDPAAADNSIPSTPSFEKVYMTRDCTAYLVNGNQAHFTKVELNLGAEVVSPKDTCSGPAYTKDTKPELSVTMKVTPDNENAFNDLKTGKEFNFVIPLFDLNGVKKWALIVPKSVVIDQKTPEDEGVLNVDRTLECRKVNGDDNFVLVSYHA